jgi:hypothetical protein
LYWPTITVFVSPDMNFDPAFRLIIALSLQSRNREYKPRFRGDTQSGIVG